MKIVKVEAIPYTIPYVHPMVFASGVLHSAEHVLVRVHTDQGHVGIGEAAARPMVYGESQRSIVNAVQEWIEPALVGLDPFSVEEAHRRTVWLEGNHTAKGATDIALHDLRARALEMPTWRLLGGSAKPQRVTRCLSMGDPAEVCDEALAAMDEYGVTSFKIKVGLDVAQDVERVRAVRDAVGAESFLFVDANHGWSAEEAIRALVALEDVGLDLVEEPSPATDRLGRLRLANRITTPIMADESARNLWEATAELTAGAARAVSIKTMRTGFTESSRIAAVAEALGGQPVLGGQADGIVGTAASLTFAAAHPGMAALPGELDHFLLITDHIVTESLPIVGGTLTPSNLPGNGIEIDPDKLEHYRIDR